MQVLMTTVHSETLKASLKMDIQSSFNVRPDILCGNKVVIIREYFQQP
jgi:hypothetical protein